MVAMGGVSQSRATAASGLVDLGKGAVEVGQADPGRHAAAEGGQGVAADPVEQGWGGQGGREHDPFRLQDLAGRGQGIGPVPAGHPGGPLQAEPAGLGQLLGQVGPAEAAVPSAP